MLPTICPTGNPVSSVFWARLTRRAASANTIPWSGIGSGSGVSSRSHASVHAVRSWRAGLPVIDRERTVPRELAASRFSTAIGLVSASATVSQIEPVHTPCAPSASAAAIWRPRPIPPAASTGTSGPTASTTSGTSTIVETSPQWPPASVPWATMHVDALRDLPLGVLRGCRRGRRRGCRARAPARRRRAAAGRARSRASTPGATSDDLDLARALLVDAEARRLHHADARGPRAAAARRARRAAPRRTPGARRGISSSRLARGSPRRRRPCPTYLAGMTKSTP